MKTLRALTILALLPIQFATAKGPLTQDDGMFTKVHAIDTYVDAMTRGKLAGFDEVLDSSAKFTILISKNRLQSFNKQEMLKFLNKIRNIEENCTTRTDIIQNTPDMVVAKVDMRFETFIRSNYVSMANTHKGWKIINVYSVFNQLQ
ncbi:MAG: nuclear transport factor 2 family protein [Mucilaginibacter sp.]